MFFSRIQIFRQSSFTLSRHLRTRNFRKGNSELVLANENRFDKEASKKELPLTNSEKERITKILEEAEKFHKTFSAY